MSLMLAIAAAVLAQGAPDRSEPGDAPVAAAAAEAAVTPYPAAFFAEGRPTSAFDMIGRLPGFTFARGEAVRGFAGAAGNVMIDGERPTSKWRSKHRGSAAWCRTPLPASWCVLW